MGIFDWPWMTLLALLAAAGMAAAVLLSFRRRLARLARFGAHELILRLVPESAIGRPRWHAARLSAAVLLALLALAGPRWGRERTIVQGEGIDIVLALDASLSMLARDERPNRLERMKQEVRRLRAESGSDRFALLAFAGRSYILTPLTVDDGALELFLDNLDPSVVGQAGSSLSRTIAQGVELLQASRSAGDRALVVMSDGEAFEEEAAVVEAARRARDAGVALITVGFGTTQGSTIPIREDNRIVQKVDEFGNVVVTRYTPQFLQAAATAAGGTFIDAGEADKAQRIRQAMRSLQGVGRSIEAGRSATPRFQLFLLPALLLVLLDLWRSERGTRRRSSPVAMATATAAGLLLLANGCAMPGSRANRGAAQYAQGRYAQAARTYRDVIDRGDRRPEMLYNLGTALVSADSAVAAIEPLERAARADNAELRYRTLFNLGLAHLKRGLAGENGADSTRAALDAALETYKRVLLSRPDDLDAKWNYELALRRRQSGGGGGGGGRDQNESERSPQPQQSERPAGGLGQEQAEQLLNSAAREERSVQGRKQRDARPTTPPRGKDW